MHNLKPFIIKAGRFKSLRRWTSFKFIAFFLICSSIATNLSSQNTSGISKADVTRELQKRGITESEFNQILAENNLNIDSVEYYSPQKINQFQSIILELERDKLVTTNDTIPPEIIDETIEPLEELDVEIDSVEIQNELEEEIEYERYGRMILQGGAISSSTDPYKIKAPPNYILGVGDELAISVWGASKVDDLHEINNDGFIKILNGSVRVFLKGLTIAKAKEKLRDAYSKFYKFNSGEFDVTLSYARTVQVKVYGEVETPGIQSVPAVNHVFSIVAEAGGVTKIGTVREIEIIRSDGTRNSADLYKYINNPSSENEIYLQDNDVIFVSPVKSLIEIEGGINRPYKYELIPSETIEDLINFAGGFDINAQSNILKVTRNSLDSKKIIDVNWPAEKQFKLENGDLVRVNSIERNLENYVFVSGAVSQEGYYELTERLKVSDLIKKSGIKEEARLDVAFIKRVGLDSSISYVPINLKQVLSNPGSSENIYLKNQDELTVWYLNRFADNSSFVIDGAIRESGAFEFGAIDNLKITDAIMLGGGLRRDASSVLIIHRQDPLNDKLKRYYTVNDLENLIENPSSEKNIFVEPFDSIFIYSQNEFLEDAFVTIRGAVNNPGQFQFGLDMKIEDIFTLAGGFKISAATDRIEISRVIITNNKPTTVVVSNLEMDRDFNIIQGESDFTLEPNDVITVRYVPEFEVQKTVYVLGEVKYPGPYTILDDNEKISNILRRTGNLTSEAFPAGATLNRKDENLGAVVIKLDEIFEDENSEFNFVVKDGDRIVIPKQQEFVTIEGATRAKTMLSDDAINLNNRIHVPFQSNKRAMFYIDEYAGGLGENADRKSIFVEYPNGEIKKSKAFLFFINTPKIRKGSTIKVRKKVSEAEEDKEITTDWSKVLQDTVSQAVTVITLILAIQSLN